MYPLDGNNFYKNFTTSILSHCKIILHDAFSAITTHSAGEKATYTMLLSKRNEISNTIARNDCTGIEYIKNSNQAGDAYYML